MTCPRADADWPAVRQPGTAPAPSSDNRDLVDDAAIGDPLTNRFVDGARFVLDAPETVPAIWGSGSDVLWAVGESLILAGPPGVGKTTLTGQVVRGLLGLQRDVLDQPVEPAQGRVLYLAMDRPQQIARALRRHFSPAERNVLSDRLVAWKGPPPADLAKYTDLLAVLADRAGASHVILDSLKDAAIGLTDDEVGSGYNRARQYALANDVQVLELHHVVKRGANGTKPNTLADLYGSAWITAGAGSVVLLWGAAGDPIVELSHLKQPADTVGPLRVIHDHTTGLSSVWHSTDALTLLRHAPASGLTAQALASSMFETDKPDRNQTERARRRLDKLTQEGLAEQLPARPAAATGGKPQVAYRAITHPITRPLPGDAITTAPDDHAASEPAGQTITHPITAITDPSNHVPTPPSKGGGTCASCNQPLDDVLIDAGETTHATCQEPQ